ncbi:VOC family protein [Saliphagus sp. LR7]|uniref:VOC family protein n=1 Tax=Saliphagus sp. LR7 TaxID=2282654 RepID=UPI000DF79522|nr:VOC family protein [Saliphagus sp. LR7]
MSQSTRAHHVGITVSDLDRCLGFYRDVLGLPVLDRFTVSGEAFATAVGIEGATGRFVHLDADGARVELVSYDPAGEERSRERVDQPGASHLGLAVEDVAAFYADLPDDVETVSEPRTTETGSTILFVRDPEGNLVELIEA